jgi:hypothetical protein
LKVVVGDNLYDRTFLRTLTQRNLSLPLSRTDAVSSRTSGGGFHES